MPRRFHAKFTGSTGETFGWRKIKISIFTDMKKNNRGLKYRRTKDVMYFGGVNREKVFADEWEKINEPLHYINHGNGILQDLFIEIKDGAIPPHWPFDYKKVHRMSNRDRMIAATVVQWFGSNCGFAFLQECLSKCGYRLVRQDD